MVVFWKIEGTGRRCGILPLCPAKQVHSTHVCRPVESMQTHAHTQVEIDMSACTCTLGRTQQLKVDRVSVADSVLGFVSQKISLMISSSQTDLREYTFIIIIITRVLRMECEKCGLLHGRGVLMKIAVQQSETQWY